MRRRERRATGPGTDRQKTSVRKQKMNSLCDPSLGGGSREVCTFASSVFSLSLRSVIRLQLRQSERKKEKKRVIGYLRIHTHTHTSRFLMQKADRATWSLFVLDGGSPVRADGRRRIDGFLRTS